eukprot:5483964-Alexandrium_andersonii.AAC.1
MLIVHASARPLYDMQRWLQKHSGQAKPGSTSEPPPVVALATQTISAIFSEWSEMVEGDVWPRVSRIDGEQSR